MELNEIEAFVTIVDAKGFIYAASLLHLSQPAVSRRISLLERELGTTLFERQPRGVVLTEAGEVFLPFARQMLATLRDGIEAVQKFNDEAQGMVKLAIVGTLASTNLTTTLQKFREKYTQIKLILHTARSNEVSTMVQNGEVHLGLRYFPDPNPKMISLVVGQENLVVTCSGYQFFKKEDKLLKPEELSKIPWVSFPLDKRSSGEPYARVLQRQLIQAGLEGAEIITIDSLTAQKRLIEAGFGVGLLPISSIQEELRLGTLQILDLPTLNTTVPIVLLRRKDGYISPAAKTLLNELKS
jgi:DNA-binding transcriptional LysR family regulator